MLELCYIRTEPKQFNWKLSKLPSTRHTMKLHDQVMTPKQDTFTILCIIIKHFAYSAVLVPKSYLPATIH